MLVFRLINGCCRLQLGGGPSSLNGARSRPGSRRRPPLTNDLTRTRNISDSNGGVKAAERADILLTSLYSPPTHTSHTSHTHLTHFSILKAANAERLQTPSLPQHVQPNSFLKLLPRFKVLPDDSVMSPKSENLNHVDVCWRHKRRQPICCERTTAHRCQGRFDRNYRDIKDARVSVLMMTEE